MDKRVEKKPVTFKKWWVLGLLGLCLGLQLVVPSRVWVTVLLGLGGALGLSYFWAQQLFHNITIERQQHYGWVHVGDLLEEKFTLQNDSALPVLWVEIDDRSDLPGYTARSVRSAGGQETREWRTEGICRQRGLFRLGPWQARMSDPFGFFEVVLEYPESKSILIYPPVVHLPTIDLPKGSATGSGRTNQRAMEVTTNASGVRAYAPGDSLRRVHWPSTARLDALMVKTFDLEPSGDLWIVLDLDAAVQAGQGEESTEEYGVILASSLADRVLRQNRAVGLVAYGSAGRRTARDAPPLPTLVLPQKGKAQQWRILEALAVVRAGGNWPLERVLAEMDRNLGRGTTLAVITPSCDPGWVASLLPPMRRGVAPAVVLLDAGSFHRADDDATQVVNGQAVEATVNLLADLGIPSHRIVQGMPFQPIMEHKRSGRPELKVLSGTGRVIAVEP